MAPQGSSTRVVAAPGTPVPTESPARGGVGVSILIVLAAFLLSQVVLIVAGSLAGTDVASSSSFVRWDSVHYLEIASKGYDLHNCNPSTYVESIYSRHDWCGNAGWFPGYPAAIRALSDGLGLAPATAGALIARVAHLAMLAILWFAFLRRRPRAAALLALGIAALFPGFVYQDGVFPVSLALVSIVASLALLARRRWWAAGVAGTVAVVSYPSAITLVLVGLVAVLAQPGLGDVRRRIACATRYAVPLVVAYGATLLMWQRSVGRWDAWMVTQRHYGYGPTFFLATWWSHVRGVTPLGLGTTGPALQTLLVAAIVGGGLAVAFVRRDRLDPQEITIAAYAAVFWLVPLSMGGALSLYRAEALLAPAAVLTVRFPRRYQVGALIACVVVGLMMTVGFFDSSLI
jgi:hypothetical protein